MRPCRSLPFLLLVAAFHGMPAASCAQLTADIGPRGEVTRLAVGDVVFFQDVALTLVKPGWSGHLVDQRAADPASVTVVKAAGTTVYTMNLDGEAGKVRLRETVKVTPDRLALAYEVTPERAVDTEAVLLQGQMPVAPHAGTTQYIAADSGLTRGVCPAALPRDSYVLFGERSADWVAFARPGGAVLRVTPTDLILSFQDDRKWNTPAFALLARAAGGRLRAGRTVRFAITYTADDSARVEADARKAAQGELSELKLGDTRPLAVRSASLDRATVETFTPVELSADVAATYANPFDPAQIAVDAEITRPDGTRINVPGFYHVPMRVETKHGAERLVVTGPAAFRVRYTPTVTGTHRVVLKATDRSGTARSAALEVTARAGRSAGFVRVAAGSPRYFAFDSGRPYFAVGENLCWSSGRTPLADYSAWLKGMGAARANWARLWLAFNEKGLEWTPPPTPKPGPGHYLGLGRYALDNAWRLDEVLRLAEANGVYLMFCLGTYGEFTEGGYFNEGGWASNPYNARNGGPCAKPADFWTNPEARRLYRQRLRYVVARWGHSPNVFAWEFWNEVPAARDRDAWVAEMSAYLKQIDPNRHLVSTTYGDARTWACPDVDFTMTHMYGQAGNTANFTRQIQADARAATTVTKPYLLAEFGIDWQTGDERWDRRRSGLNMHNGAWSALMSGAAGTAMLWYWDGYIHPSNLYHVLTPARAFADTVDWSRTRFRPIDRLAVEQAQDGPETFTDLTVAATHEWGRTPSAEYTVLHDGTVQGGPVAMTIGSPARGNPAELPTKLAWRVDMPRAGQVVARLGQVCSRARLRVTVDGQVKIDRALSSGAPGAGPWKSAKRLEQWNVWVSDYDEDITIDVPAGSHVVAFANAEGDWLQIRSLRIPGYRSSRFPNVEVIGLESDALLLLWVHNLESTWRTEHDGKTPSTLRSVRVRVPAREGTWSVEWWDTFKGQVVRRETVRTSSGALLLPVPDFATDLAARIVR